MQDYNIILNTVQIAGSQAPSSSGLGRQVFILEIRGSIPLGATKTNIKHLGNYPRPDQNTYIVRIEPTGMERYLELPRVVEISQGGDDLIEKSKSHPNTLLNGFDDDGKILTYYILPDGRNIVSTEREYDDGSIYSMDKLAGPNGDRIIRRIIPLREYNPQLEQTSLPI